MKKQITVKKKIRVENSKGRFDEYVLTYASFEKVKSNLFWFRLIKIDKNNRLFAASEESTPVDRLPELGDSKLLRVHNLRWNVRNFNRAGGIVRWFNVHQPCKDEDYVQSPKQLYPIWRKKTNGDLMYPRVYENKY